MVEAYPVSLRVLPPVCRHRVEAGSMLPQRFLKCYGLLSGRFKPKANGSLHGHILTYFEKGGKRRRSSPALKGRGLPAAIEKGDETADSLRDFVVEK
ncbi:MAG: hypothetical protein QW420_07755 [Candidatus Caldarchaeum sp.]